jgi:multicomponent Na+:H+ antiporter subunit G
MALFIEISSWILILIGAFALVCGAIGVVRFPDVYTRMHAASITDTLGSAAILIGLMLQAGPTLISAKLGLILIFIFITSPTSSFSLAHAALSSGVEPELKNDWRDEHPTQQTKNSEEREQ